MSGLPALSISEPNHGRLAGYGSKVSYPDTNVQPTATIPSREARARTRVQDRVWVLIRRGGITR